MRNPILRVICSVFGKIDFNYEQGCIVDGLSGLHIYQPSSRSGKGECRSVSVAVDHIVVYPLISVIDHVFFSDIKGRL